jgi:FdhD protein
MYTEDVGRHNAADAISGYMWLDEISGSDKIFYTTGRLTSEIVMKAAHMGLAELAQELGVTMIARAKGRHFLVYHGAGNIVFDAPPEPRPVREK